MVTSYLEAYTKASKTKPGSGRSISSISTATSSLHSVPDSHQVVREEPTQPPELLSPEFPKELPRVEGCSEGQPEETSSGEFAFLEVAPEDSTVLHNVTTDYLFWQPSLPEPHNPPEIPQEVMSSSIMHLRQPMGCEEKSGRPSAPLQHASSFHEGFGSDSLPVRNTFIHIGSEEDVQRQWSSCPGMIMTKEFHTKYPAMEPAHMQGDCRPCAYFIHKGDGCRWGEQCRFCHLCPPSALKKKKKEKVKALKQRDYFMRIASLQTNAT